MSPIVTVISTKISLLKKVFLKSMSKVAGHNLMKAVSWLTHYQRQSLVVRKSLPERTAGLRSEDRHKQETLLLCVAFPEDLKLSQTLNL